MKPFVICGPTASGKTDLALALARETGGVIISADSRQVYKHLTIGTAKPQGTWTEGSYLVEGVEYHLVDFLEITDRFNAAAFCAKTREIAARYPRRPLIFAGGTGMYLHAYFVGMDELPPSTPASRHRVEEMLAQLGPQGLHHELAQKDPLSAQLIPPGNTQRTMRALEICLLSGQPASALKSGQFFQLPPQEKAHFVYLDWEKEALLKRIETRTERIFEGMVHEAQTLLNAGFSPDTPALKSLGYPQAIEVVQGTLTPAQARERIVVLTRQYAKRQRTWFNRYNQATRISLTEAFNFQPEALAKQLLLLNQR